MPCSAGRRVRSQSVRSVGTRAGWDLRAKARSWAVRSAALVAVRRAFWMCRPLFSGLAFMSRASSRWPMTPPNRLLKSWAMPAARRLTAERSVAALALADSPLASRSQTISAA